MTCPGASHSEAPSRMGVARESLVRALSAGKRLLPSTSRGAPPAVFHALSYAIISVGGKQYRVREGERLLVDRLATAEGKTFTPTVLLLGGDGETQFTPKDVTVTARVVAQQRGPKITIGKYRQRTGFRRHTGFRAALTQIEIESIGARKGRAAAREKEAPATPAAVTALPSGYDDLTVAQVKETAGSWSAAALSAALEHERGHGQRKGAIAALEAAIADKLASIEAELGEKEK
jgi:large subunit ribosomal protein L21